ncbi:hypothetical protein FB451DRAFT_1183008, partial [Mycena latifolia]
YSVNIVERFEANDDLKHLVPIIKRMRFSVPALHVQGHKLGCLYAYSTAYMLATTHFHGETAEHYWPELNQIGPQTRQMNGGHRQDTIINHHGDWNYKKMAKAATDRQVAVALLIDALLTGEVLFEQHLNQFLGLTASYARRIVDEKWMEIDRKPDTRNMKDVGSVYRYKKGKVPTQSAIYEKMLEDESALPSSTVPRKKAATFISEGMKIQELQVQIRVLVTANTEHPLVATQRAIASLRSKVGKRVAKFQKEQRVLTPAVGEYLTKQVACEVEVELLGLPSDFREPGKRHELDLAAMAEVEGRLREGAAFDSIHRVQIVAKALVGMRDRKKKNDTGVYKNTISQQQINDTKERRKEHIEKYMVSRNALMVLGLAEGTAGDFPPLAESDTFMKSRLLKRGLGDSRKVDGRIWTQAGVGAGARIPAATFSSILGTQAETPGITPAASTSTLPVVETRGQATAMSRRKTAPRAPKPKDPTTRKPGAIKKNRRDDGWIWTFSKMGKMDAKELKEWEREGDRVQWFRAEAEMQRWQEEAEAKLAELRTTVRSFAAYKAAWEKMADLQESSNIGHIAYAKQKAWMFGERERLGRDALRKLARYASLAEDDADLVEFVEAQRAIHKASFQAILDASEIGRQKEAEQSLDSDEEEEDWDSDDSDDE